MRGGPGLGGIQPSQSDYYMSTRGEGNGDYRTPVMVVAYGTTSKIVKNAIDILREEGIKAGLIRPKTLWPFPNEAFTKIPNVKNLLTVEISMGQMVEDVKLAVECKLPVHFYGRCGGMIPYPESIANKAREIIEDIVKKEETMENVKLGIDLNEESVSTGGTM